MAEYNSREVAVSVGGILMEGFGEDTMVSVTYDSDFTTDKLGVDGVTTASKTNDLRADVTITLMETSPSNAILVTFAEARRLGPSSIGVTTLHIQNLLTGEEFTAPAAWVKRMPDAEFGAEASEREWTLRCAKLLHKHAGLQPA